jgi:signal transduction histidine kinase
MLPRPSRTLQRSLAIRVVAVSVSACIALTVFFALRYMLDTPRLRRLTLENEVRTIIEAMVRRDDPARWPQFTDYPENYAFRVYDHRTADRRKLIAEANPSLLPLLATGGDNAEFTLSEGFGPAPGPNGSVVADSWQMTDHVDVKDRSYWVQVVMVGDPDWRWRWVIGEEVRDHVMVPVLFIIPALSVAMLLTTMSALRPLRRIAALAGSLGRAISSGAPLSPLPEDDLPLEVRNVVTAINAMLNRLERSLQLQKQFASDVAHEVRTPLAVVVLAASGLPPSPARDTITEELNELGTLVNQLLRFAQAEDVMSREQHMLDLAEVARKVGEDLAGAAIARGVVIEYDAPALPVSLLGHAALIDMAIRNVADNAIRLAPAGSAVSITVKPPGEVIVDDRGPGVPDAHKQLIFDRFWRADRTRGGVGIGLALVRRVARLHGGDVRVEDHPGGGARFILTFVSSDAATAVASAVRQEPSEALLPS